MNEATTYSPKSSAPSSLGRAIRAFILAVVVAGVVAVTVHLLYSHGFLVVAVSDGQGHGPDVGSLEWRGAADNVIAFDRIFFGAVSFVVTFIIAYIALRRRARVATHP